MANKGMKGLLVWCKKYTEGYRSVNVTNMSSSWKDGLAFCALLHRFRPDLIDFESLSKENVFYNNQLAFEIAEKELGIAALLDAEDMANMKSPDRLSVMTYLSQYYSCFRHCNLEDNKPHNVPVINPAGPAKIYSLPRRPTDESICCICRKRVHLVQRYFEGGELHHRTCHRTKSLEKIRGKNYFVKRQQKRRETEADGVNKVKCDVTTNTNALYTESKPNEHQRLGLVLPNLVESPSSAEVKTVKISTSSLSAVTEDKKLPNALHMEASSLISELPRNMETQEGITTDTTHLDVPRPRARTSRRSTEDGGRVSLAPVAQPRSKVNQEPAECEKLDYNEILNPFGTDSGSDSDITLSSGSDSDTTLSSESSDEDFNPFENIPKKRVESYHSPVVVMKEINPFENAVEAKSDKDKWEASDEECKNPFGVWEEEEAPQNEVRQHKPSDRFNPFPPDFKDLAEEEKRMPALVPPRGVTPTQVSSAWKIKSPHKKAPALPPPPEWKQSASLKMLELNKTDTQFTQNQSPKPARPPAPSQSPTKTIMNHAAKQEKRPTRKKTRSAPGYGYPLIKRKVEIKMSEEEMTTELKLLDIKLTDYETKGVKLEQMLRFAMDSDAEWTSEEGELLQEWFDLVNKKNILLREESDLVFQMQQQRLEQEHADIEFQMRKLLNKPDSAKTDQDKIEEEELLKKLLEVVESRDVIVKSIEEERHKEAEEDMAYAQMRKVQQKQSKKMKKNKVKKMFSKKDKTKKEKKHAAKKNYHS